MAGVDSTYTHGALSLLVPLPHRSSSPGEPHVVAQLHNHDNPWFSFRGGRHGDVGQVFETLLTVPVWDVPLASSRGQGCSWAFSSAPKEPHSAQHHVGQGTGVPRQTNTALGAHGSQTSLPLLIHLPATAYVACNDPNALKLVSL